MARSRTQMYTEGHSYSLFDPEEIHRDLRMDHVRARIVMGRSRGVADAHEFCDECRTIARELEESEGPRPAAGYTSLDDAIVAHSERRVKWVLSRANIARMLGLGRGERIARMWLSDDPQALHVVITGEHHRQVPDGSETPLVKASRVALSQTKN